MKKFTLFLLAAITLFSCTQKVTETLSGNYVPETPQLNSDIMTPEVLWSFGRLGSAQISPDGKTVLYTVTYYNIEENKSYRDIYTIPFKGGEAKRITNTVENEFNVLWRPDGKKIGYLSSKSGSVQLWEINPDGFEFQVSKMAWNRLHGLKKEILSGEASKNSYYDQETVTLDKMQLKSFWRNGAIISTERIS